MLCVEDEFQCLILGMNNLNKSTLTCLKIETRTQISIAGLAELSPPPEADVKRQLVRQPQLTAVLDG